MRIFINKIHFPVTTLGYGRRVGVWTQGCSIHCPGCISRDTWDSEDRHAVELDELVKTIGPWLTGSDGVTISGGEPFDQPAALSALVAALRPVIAGDVLVFSGYPHQKLFSEHPSILGQIDVLISEPFVAGAGQTLNLRGSDNQKVFLLSDRARNRYPANLDQEPWPAKRRLDVVVEGDAVWMAGIPQPGEMARLRKELARRGFGCKTSDQPEPTVRA